MCSLFTAFHSARIRFVVLGLFAPRIFRSFVLRYVYNLFSRIVVSLFLLSGEVGCFLALLHYLPEAQSSRLVPNFWLCASIRFLGRTFSYSVGQVFLSLSQLPIPPVLRARLVLWPFLFSAYWV